MYVACRTPLLIRDDEGLLELKVDMRRRPSFVKVLFLLEAVLAPYFSPASARCPFLFGFAD